MTARQYRDSETVDFAVVGSGASGGVIARQLAQAGLSVVVLEQGPRFSPADFTHDELKDWYLGGITNDAIRNPQTFRNDPAKKAELQKFKPALWYGRTVGGGSLHYTANFWRFHEIDFIERSVLGAIPGTGFADWPITYADLEPYYTKVEWEIGVSGLAGASPLDPPRTRPYPMPPLPVKSSGVLLERGARKLGLHPFPSPMAINSQLDGKLTARVQLDRRFVVRGSISTGFRAPSLGQSFFSSTATNFLNLGQGLVPVESLTLPVDSAAAKVLGAAPLKPERSLNTGGGVVIAPMSSLDITIDYYRITIDDRIVLSGNFTAPPIAALLAPFGANSARFFTNAIDTRTNGVDVTANYRTALGTAGELRLRAGYNDTRTKVVGSIATPPQLMGFASVLFDRIEQRRIECGQPNDSVRLGGGWSRKRLNVNLTLARYGEFCSFTQNPADDQEYSPKWLTDLEASYQVAGYLLAVGAQNLFDVFPDRNSTVNSFNGIQTFPRQSPFGMNGRAIYARIGRTF